MMSMGGGQLMGNISMEREICGLGRKIGLTVRSRSNGEGSVELCECLDVGEA